MSEGKIFYGYIPPKSFAFSNMSEALGHFIAALVSVECSRFIQYIETHPSKGNSYLSHFLAPYTLRDWSTGVIDEIVWRKRGRQAKESIQLWATAMIEFNTFFRDVGIEDPVKFVEEKKLVIRAGRDKFGWSPNIEEIDKILKLGINDIKMTNI